MPGLSSHGMPSFETWGDGVGSFSLFRPVCIHAAAFGADGGSNSSNGVPSVITWTACSGAADRRGSLIFFFCGTFILSLGLGVS